MKLKLSIFLFVLICIFSSALISASQYPEVLMNQNDRILVLAPHPDDEVIACGGIIQKALSMNIPLQIVFYTYGDNNEWSFILYRKHLVVSPKSVQEMGLIRHDEAVSADKILGVPKENLIFLGYPDFGTLNIWYEHWRDNPPFTSMLTKVTQVPYQNAMRPGAQYKGEEILKDLTTVIRTFNPTKIFLSHPADYNRDHASLYLFTQIVLWNIEREIKPEIYTYLVHFPKWPKPRGYFPKLEINPPEHIKGQIEWTKQTLTDIQTNVKSDALKKHATQYRENPTYLLSFERSNELFGNFSVIKQKEESKPIYLGPKTTTQIDRQSEELSPHERFHYVDVEWDYIDIQDDNLILSASLSKPLGEAVDASIGIFGYRGDLPFPEMPKIHIKINKLGHEVLDNGIKLFPHSIEVIHRPKQITVKIPLKLLGTPKKILACAHTHLEHVPLDNTPWRVIELE